VISLYLKKSGILKKEKTEKRPKKKEKKAEF
jgi:hypothetical protein